MENQVTMSLEDYTKLITENCLLKSKMSALKNQADKLIIENIKDNIISTLEKEKVLYYLEEKNKGKALDNLYSYGNSSWHWQTLSNTCVILSPNEVRDTTYALIIKSLECRLDDIMRLEAQDNGN